ncbi:MAG: hypothetical protein EA418_06950 [Wenzhouxiangellaceae bacterium]|nr:MAG: hypothetical protein EA418_06950 [Wenzhouxiangellaceae bacterium]
MSLINEVLRELEQRGEAHHVPSARAGTRMASRTRASAGWGWWLLAAVILGVVLHLGWRDVAVPDNSLVMPAEASPAQPEPKPALLQAGGLVPAASLARTVRPTAASSLAPVPETGHYQNQQLTSAPRTKPSQPLAPSPQAHDLNSSASVQTRPEPVDEPVSSSADETAALIRIERVDRDASTPAALSARRALSRGQEDLARQQLESHLEQAPEDHEARLLLARMHQRSDRADQAYQLLEAGLSQAEPGPIAAALARLMLADNQAEPAVELLLQHAESMDGDVDYQLLLAAAFRQSGADEQALILYHGLSQSIPERGQVWIGLGSSLEALNRPQDARAAYLQALHADDARAIAFARSRLAALPEHRD